MSRRVANACLIVFLGSLVLIPTHAVAADKKAADKKKDDKAGAATKDVAAEGSTAAKNSDTAVRCVADTFYTWKRLPPRPEPKAKSSDKAPAVVQPDEAFFQRIEEFGPTEDVTKDKLRAKFADAQSKARRECETLHEDQSGCLMNALKTAKSDYQVFDYNIRRSYLNALNEDCQLNSGVCVSTRVGTVACNEAEPKTPPADGTAAADGKTPDKPAEKAATKK